MSTLAEGPRNERPMASNIEREFHQAGRLAVLPGRARREGPARRPTPLSAIEGIHTVLKEGVTVGDVDDLVIVEHSTAHGCAPDQLPTGPATPTEAAN